MTFGPEDGPKTFDELLGVTAERLSHPETFLQIDQMGTAILDRFVDRLVLLGLVDLSRVREIDDWDALLEYLSSRGIRGESHALNIFNSFKEGNSEVQYLPWLISPEDTQEHAWQMGHVWPTREILHVLPSRVSGVHDEVSGFVIDVEGSPPTILMKRSSLSSEKRDAVESTMRSLPMARFCLLGGQFGVETQSVQYPK